MSLYTHEQPFEPVGKLENLPVPSFHDCDIANTSKFKVDSKFLCSDDNNCNATSEVPLLNTDEPILLDIVDFISSFLNLIKALEG